MKSMILALLAALSLSACSVVMATQAEKKRDFDLASSGLEKSTVRAEFGEPVTSGVENGEDYDVFTFVQGRSTESNAGRAVLYGAAAVMTLGLSEVIATPLESAVGEQGEVKMRVFYDEGDTVTRSQVFDNGAWISLEAYKTKVANSPV